jgi:lipid-A-disaccharide synthase
MKVGIVAGEASGDLFGAHLIRHVRAVLPQARFVGVAGPRMQAEGAESWYPMERLSVRGYAEVLRHLPGLLAMRRDLARRFLADPPRLFVGVDAPDFNLGLERTLKRAGVPTAQFIAPTVWAWRPERVSQLRDCAALVLSIFPFEAELLAKAGVNAAYVGHPAADLTPERQDRAAARVALGLSAEGPVIALLPGSRPSELNYHADLFVRCAELVAVAVPGVRFVAALADEGTRAQFQAAVGRARAGVAIEIVTGQAHRALEASDVALVASGTATLEAALLRRPMVITYVLSRASYRIIRRKYRLPYVGQPNIICGEFVVPELIQDDATPVNLAQALVNLLQSPRLRERIVARLERMRSVLRQDSGRRIAEALVPMLRS